MKITSADVGKTVKLRGGGVGEIVRWAPEHSAYPVVVEDCGARWTATTEGFRVQHTTDAKDAVSFVSDTAQTPRVELTSAADGRRVRLRNGTIGVVRIGNPTSPWPYRISLPVNPETEYHASRGDTDCWVSVTKNGYRYYAGDKNRYDVVEILDDDQTPTQPSKINSLIFGTSKVGTEPIVNLTFPIQLGDVLEFDGVVQLPVICVTDKKMAIAADSTRYVRLWVTGGIDGKGGFSPSRMTKIVSRL